MKCFKHLTRAGKILLLSAVVAFAASTAFAESVESKSSEKIFRGDADYFNSTILWNNLELDKVYIESALTSQSLDIGAALNLGGFYISANYNGNIASSSSKNNKTATAEVSELTGHDEYTTWAKVTNTEKDTSSWNPDNDIQVMLGIANMGIKLGYAGSGTAKSGKFGDLNGTEWYADETYSFTSAADSQTYTDTVYGKGKRFWSKFYIPMVGFGIDLGFIKPYVDVRLPIFANGGSYSNTVTTVTNGYTTQEKTTEAKEIYGYFGINPTIGAEIALGEDARIEASYAPYFYIYNKDNGSTVTTTKTVNYNVTGTNVGKQTTNTESVTGAGNARFKMNNDVKLAFVYTKEVADRVTVGGKAGVGVDFNFDNTTTRNNSTTTTTTSYDANYDSTSAGIAYETVTTKVIEKPATKTNWSEVNVKPQLAGSVNFAAVPEKVSLIAGLGVNVKVAYEKTTTTHDMNVTTTTTTTTNSLTGRNQTTKNVTVTNAPGEESSNVVLTTTPEASAWLGAVFTPTENFAISTCLELKTFSSNPFADIIVQAQVKF